MARSKADATITIPTAVGRSRKEGLARSGKRLRLSKNSDRLSIRLRSKKGLLMKRIASLEVNTGNGLIKSNATTTTPPSVLTAHYDAKSTSSKKKSKK